MILEKGPLGTVLQKWVSPGWHVAEGHTWRPGDSLLEVFLGVGSLRSREGEHSKLRVEGKGVGLEAHVARQ